MQFLIKIFDYHFEQEKYLLEIDKLNSKNLYLDLAFLKSHPKEGSELVAELLMMELLNKQKYTKSDLILFYNCVVYNFFGYSSD